MVALGGLGLNVAAASDYHGSITQGGSSVTVTLSTSGDKGYVTFGGTSGEQLGLGFTSNSFSYFTLKLNDPGGSTAYTKTVFSSTTDVSFPTLASTGTYTIVIDPGTGMGSVILTLSDDLTDTITVGGSSKTVTISRPGQNESLTFSGTAGENLGLGVTGSTMSGSIYLYRSTGVQVGGTLIFVSNGDKSINWSNLPANDTYTIFVDPGTTTGSATLTLSDDLVVPMTTLNSPVLMTLPRAGQNARFTFTGSANAALVLGLSKNSIPCCSSVELLDASGLQVGGTGSFSGSDGNWNVPALPADGSYSIFFDPAANTGSGIFTLGEAPADPPVPPKPPTDSSYYVKYPYNGGETPDSSSNAWNYGCDQGTFDASHGNAHSEVVLDFGAQNTGNTGTYLPKTNTPVTYANVEQYAENFAYGYWVCTGSDTTSTLELAIGTNNSGSLVTSAAGNKWADVVNTVHSWTSSGIYSAVSAQVRVYGASDIEPAWSSQSAAIAWTDGYDGNNSAPFYVDYGSCDGCATTATTGNGYSFVPCAGCSTWYQYGVWEVAWGEPDALPLPEIYVNNQQGEWAAISDYGRIAKSSTVYFLGPLDEHDLDTATYTSSDAWTNFWTALQGFSGAVAQTPPYSAEIHDTSN